MAFKQNQSGFKKLAHSRGVAKVCLQHAEKVAATARSTAPVDTGDYAGSIRAVIEDHHTRVTAQVIASDPKSMLIESMTGNLARSLNGAGGLVQYTNKAGKKSWVTKAQADNYNRNKKS